MAVSALDALEDDLFILLPDGLHFRKSGVHPHTVSG